MKMAAGFLFRCAAGMEHGGAFLVGMQESSNSLNALVGTAGICVQCFTILGVIPPAFASQIFR